MNLFSITFLVVLIAIFGSWVSHSAPTQPKVIQELKITDDTALYQELTELNIAPAQNFDLSSTLLKDVDELKKLEKKYVEKLPKRSVNSRPKQALKK